MRIQQLIGVVLIALGAYVLVRGVTFTTKETVIDLGPSRRVRTNAASFRPGAAR